MYKDVISMSEKYTYKITKDHSLFAGYLLHTMKGNYHVPSLFTNLRIIRIIKGSANITIDKVIYTIKENDIMVLNNLTPRQFSKLIEEELVAVVPGIAFGADANIRFSYATSDVVIEKGLERMAKFCSRL